MYSLPQCYFDLRLPSYFIHSFYSRSIHLAGKDPDILTMCWSSQIFCCKMFNFKSFLKSFKMARYNDVAMETN